MKPSVARCRCVRVVPQIHHAHRQCVLTRYSLRAGWICLPSSIANGKRCLLSPHSRQIRRSARPLRGPFADAHSRRCAPVRSVFARATSRDFAVAADRREHHDRRGGPEDQLAELGERVHVGDSARPTDQGVGGHDRHREQRVAERQQHPDGTAGCGARRRWPSWRRSRSPRSHRTGRTRPRCSRAARRTGRPPPIGRQQRGQTSTAASPSARSARQSATGQQHSRPRSRDQTSPPRPARRDPARSAHRYAVSSRMPKADQHQSRPAEHQGHAGVAPSRLPEGQHRPAARPGPPGSRPPADPPADSGRSRPARRVGFTLDHDLEAEQRTRRPAASSR